METVGEPSGKNQERRVRPEECREQNAKAPGRNGKLALHHWRSDGKRAAVNVRNEDGEKEEREDAPESEREFLGLSREGQGAGIVYQERGESNAKRQGESRIRDTVAEHSGRRNFFHAADLCGHENGGLAGRVRNGDFNRGVFRIVFAAAKTEAAFGDIVALDDFFVEVIHANACREIDARAHMAPAIRFSTARKCRRDRRF